jgi:Ser/Thr protein kinase RdoA (MazF antagonist)
MENSIIELFTAEILTEALSRYSIKPGSYQALDGFESFIYAFRRGEEEGLLRLSHSIRRSPELIRGEMDWINYLHQGGASVAQPLRSERDNWVEAIPDGQGGHFLAAAFEKIRGVHQPSGVWPRQLLREYGVQLGRIHQLSKEYTPSNPAWKRPEWHDPVNLEIDRFLPREDGRIRDIYHQLLAYLRALPVDESGYGLIHQDPHPGNFFVSPEGRITFFDFDDCIYSWYVNDIALVLFYTAMGQDDQSSFITRFLADFLPGYFSQTALDLKWFQEVPHFITLREIDLYALIHRSFDMKNLQDPWVAWYMKGRKERLEGGIPFLELDFDSLDWGSFI